jgi:hypothetical protein
VTVAGGVGVSVGKAGFVGALCVSVVGRGGVAVKTRGGVGTGEQEEKIERKKREDKRMRVVMRRGMEGILPYAVLCTRVGRD